jgi:hypothetical protein
MGQKLLNYSFQEQLNDFFPSFILSSIMGLFVYFLGLLDINVYLLFTIQVFLGAAFYFLISFVFKNKQMIYFLDLFREIKTKNTFKNMK